MPSYKLKPKEVSIRPDASKYPFKRLGFFEAFLRAVGATQNDVADIVGIKQSSVCRWFLIDDVMISNIYEVANHYGYNLEPQVFTNNESVNERTRDLSRYLIAKSGGKLEIKKLTFLQLALDLEPRTKEEIAKEIGIEYPSISRWFRMDDIAVSRLVQLCDILGWRIQFDFKLKPEEMKKLEENNEKKGFSYHIDIVGYDCM